MNYLESIQVNRKQQAKEFAAGTTVTALQDLMKGQQSIYKLQSIIYMGMCKLGFANTPFINATLGQVGMTDDTMGEMFMKTLNTSSDSISGVQYKYPVYGNRKEGTYITANSGAVGAKLGMGGSDFTIKVKEKRITKNGAFVVDGRMLIVQAEPTLIGSDYSYRVKLQGASQTDYIPAEKLTAGTFVSTVAMSLNSTSHSVGTYGSTFNFPEVTNQIGTFRKSYEISGLDNDVFLGLKIQMPDGRIVSTFMEWEAAVFTMKFWSELESWLFLSKYNRTTSGVVVDIDPNSGLPAPAPAGILEQIEAGGVYSGIPFTKEFIRDSILDTFNFNYSGFSKPKSREVWCITGSVGAAMWADEFAKDNEFLMSLKSGDSVSFKDGYAEVGTYVTNYRLLDGTLVRLMVSDMFDKGAYADSKELSINGKPITSSEMIFVDMTRYETNQGRVQNMKFVSNKDTSFLVGVEAGMTTQYAKSNLPTPGSIISPFNVVNRISTDVASSSVHFLATAGIFFQMPQGAFIYRPY